MRLLTTTRLALGPSGTTAFDYLRRPDVPVQTLRELLPAAGAPKNVWTQVDIEAKYAGYIGREKQAALRMREWESKTIPAAFNFARMAEMRTEARQALEKFRPATVGQAGRLEGVTPSDLTILMVHLRGKVGAG